MATESGAGEGQALAHRLLEALDEGRTPDWDAFHSTYRHWLTHVAAGCLNRNSGLGSEFDGPEELVNAFLAEKVLPPRQARLMLGTPARGECPLRPRLAVSLRNFCIDVLRARPPTGGRAAATTLDRVEAREEMPLPDYEDVAGVIARQVGDIRTGLPLQQGAPYPLALLLRHRLDWAGVFDGVRLPQTGGGDSIELTLAVLEGLTAWENDELRTRGGVGDPGVKNQRSTPGQEQVMIIRTTEHGPTLLTPQELLLSRLPGLLSLWQHDRDRGTGAYRTAQDLVAAWSGLQRLVLPEHPSEALCRLDEVIRDDTALFLEAIVSHDFDCKSWQRKMEQLDTDWDQGREQAEELEWRTRETFDALDRMEMFAWFAATKVPSDARIQGWLESVIARYEGAEQFIAARPDLFLCLAMDLAAVIASGRPELEEKDPLLWETLGKHRRIEEARDEVELAPSRHVVLGGVPRGARGSPAEALSTNHLRAAESVSAESAGSIPDHVSQSRGKRSDTDSVSW